VSILDLPTPLARLYGTAMATGVKVTDGAAGIGGTTTMAQVSRPEAYPVN
jgi:hypothetical protein